MKSTQRSIFHHHKQDKIDSVHASTILKLFLIVLTYTLYPGNCESLIVNNLSQFDHLNPGDNARISLTLTNEFDYPDTITLNICDYGCNSSGEHFFDEPNGKRARSSASWITLTNNQIKMAPNESIEYFYTIQVPKDSSLKGSYWSVLLIEPEGPLKQVTQSGDGLQLNVKIRYAHHIVTNIGEGAPKLKIVEKKIQNLDGKKFLKIDVANIGELFLNPKLTLKIYDDNGKLVNSLDGGSERLYPGNSQAYLLNIEGLDEKKINGFLLLDSGESHLFGDTFAYP